MRTDQKVRGEEDCGRGIRLGSWRRSAGSTQHWGLILKRMDLNGKSLRSHALDFRALSSPSKDAGKSNQQTCGIASCHMVQGGKTGRPVRLVARE